MFRTFFFSELKYGLKQPMVYIFMGVMALLTFGATVSDSVFIGGAVGNIYKNAPHVITIYVSTLTIFGLLIATAFYNNAALRDFSNGFNEILFSTPISKAGYFLGRFFGALTLSTIPMMGMFLGVLIGSALAPVFGWVDGDRFGSFYIETFINNYFLFILPNMFIAGTLIFVLANKWKSTVISFLGALIIIIGYLVSDSLMSDVDNETIAALTDAFGIRTYSIQTKYYTPIEKNTLSPGFSGILFLNRLLWMGIGAAILIVSYFSFSFKEKGKKVKPQKVEKNDYQISLSLPQLHSQFDIATAWHQFKSFFYTNFISIVKSPTFRILFLFSLITMVTDLFGSFEYFGLKSYPITYKMVDFVKGETVLFIMIILVFFSGELVWRDRNNRIHEVVDATPHTSHISLIAKALSLVGVTLLFHFFFVLCAIVYQLLNGYTAIELSLYFLDFVYTDLMMYIIWSGVMIMIQVLLHHRYIGYFVSVLVIFIWNIILSALNIESNMLNIGRRPSLQYSDMNAFGPGFNGAMWFNAYWLLFSIICLLIAGVLWNRGTGGPLKRRLLNARKQTPRSYRLLIPIFGVLWLLVASYVYYNTQILNDYKTSNQEDAVAADYEKKYKKYESIPQPKITDVKYFMDIFPYERNVDVKAILELTNETLHPIDSIHFTFDENWQPEINLQNSKIILKDEELGYLIYKLDEPILPGASISTEIKTKYLTKGFANDRGNTSVVKNGTFLNNFTVLPSLGYVSGIELTDKNIRKKYGLLPKERMPALEKDHEEAAYMKNYISNGKSDYINIETIISTAADQTAIAPGSLLKKWTENGRNYFHYKVDHPSQNMYSFISARYEITKRKWKDVDIEIYHDKKHSVNVPMMLDAVERSLEYYSENFGPYYHKQCRIIEFPRYANFAQAFPGTMPYAESFGFVINLENEEGNNVIDAVIAHEMAHQWWAHQVVGAYMQGSTLLSEAFSEYSALMTMKHISNNPMKMREFLKYDHDRYLRGRTSEISKETPLLKVENQGYIHYGKGSVILYALQDYIGEDKVNTAMKDFLEEFRYKEPPYPTALDFLKHLEPQVPDSLKYLIDDWFKEITLYDNRMKDATYKELSDGKYEVSITVESHKIRADSIGNETQIPINDWIDIGVFSDSNEERLVYQKRVKIDKPEMTFTFKVDTFPARAAIDPRMLLIDRIYKDNIKTISLE